MSATTADDIQTLNVCFGSYPHTKALKDGRIASDRVAMSFTEINPVNRAFMPMAREQKFDVSEMAIVTYLQAKAYGKPITLLPVTMMGRFQHGTMLYNSERGTVRPQDLPGRTRRRAGVLADHRRLDPRHSVEGLRPRPRLGEMGDVRGRPCRRSSSDPPGVVRAAAGKDITRCCSTANSTPRSSAATCRTTRGSRASFPIRMRRRRPGTSSTAPCR